VAEVVSTNQFRNGMHIELDGQTWRIVEFQHVKPGKGGAFVRTKLKAFGSGAVVDRTFRAGEKFERVRTETKEMQYLYDAGDEVVFMETDTYDQLSLPRATVEDALPFMQPSSSWQGLFVNERPAGIHLPASVVLEVMPKLGDTTIRILGQEPLAGAMPTSALLQLAEVLDGAGFAYLEISGGGVFDSAVHRAVESPWERIRALKARTKTPLALAVRGRFLVGSRPVGRELARRFVESAASSGIDVFRLHDPLNDAHNLRDAAEAIPPSRREFDAGLLYGSNRREALVEAARRLP